MAALVPPDNTIRLTVRGTWLTTSWRTHYWLQASSLVGMTPTEASVLLDAFLTAWQTATSPYRSTTHICTGVDGVFRMPILGPIPYSYEASLAGADAGNELPASVAYSTSWKILDYYRGGKPHNLINGLTESHTVGTGGIDPVTCADIETAQTTFQATVNALTAVIPASVTLGTVRFHAGGALIGPPGIFFPYLADGPTVRPIFAHVRKRDSSTV